MMESWRTVWREGFAKVTPLAGLLVLKELLEKDDPKLLQGTTTKPPPLMCVQDWPVEGCDAISATGLTPERSFGVATVGEIEEHFADMCFEADRLLCESAACRWFLNWWDDTPRGTAIAELLAEVEKAISEKSEIPT